MSQPTPAGLPAGPEPPLAQIGDIVVSQHWVTTPNGSAPLAGSQWTVQDRSYPVQRTPTWAIVLAVLGAFFFLLGLFFLLVKETQYEGYVEVTVRAGGVYHMVQLPRAAPAGYQAFQQVAYVQQLAQQAAAGY